MPSNTSESPSPSGAASPAGADGATRRPQRAQRLAWPRRAATLLGALLLGLVGLLALTWLVVDAAIVPRIDQWRPEVERHATAALGVKVRIGHLSAERSGVLPKLSLHDVRLLDDQARPALALTRIDARITPWALLQGLAGQDPPGARLALHTPALQVRRDAAGRLWVGGLPLPSTGGGDPQAALDWLFSQRAITLRGGRLLWTDEQRGAPPLALQAVEIRLRNRGGLLSREHSLSLRATPPADWGGPVSVAGAFTQPRIAIWTPARPGPQGEPVGMGRTRPSDLRSWSGQASVALPRTDAAVLRRDLPLPAALMRALQGGRGSLSADLRWRRGQLAGVSATLALRDLDLRLGESLLPLRLAHLTGRLGLDVDEDGGRLQGQDLSFGLLRGEAAGGTAGVTIGATTRTMAGTTAAAASAPAADALAAAAPATPPASAAPPLPPLPPLARVPAVDTWPASRFELAWHAPAQPPAPGSAASWAPGLRWDAARGGSLQADRLDLGLLAALAQRLPLPADVQGHVASLSPRGIARDLDLRWDGPATAPDRYTARGRIQGLSVQAREARAPGGRPAPAVRGAASAPAATTATTAAKASTATAATAATTAPPAAGPRAPVPAAAASHPAPHHPIGRPGVDGASLRFEATQKGGTAELAIRQGAVTLPGVFEAPRIPLRELSARLSWTVQRRPGLQPALELRVRQARLANEDLQGELEATWRTGDPARREQGRGAWLPGRLDLDGRLSQARATAVARYLPQTLPADARRYVRDAVRAGELDDVRFAVHGDLWDVPYPRGGGQFLIRGQIREATLAYVPHAVHGTAAFTPAGPPTATSTPARTRASTPSAARPAAASPTWPSPAALRWPLFTELHGELVFEQQSMAIRGARARLGTVGSGRFALTGIEGRIADLARSTLVIDGQGSGPLDDLLQYLRTSPLGDWTGQALGEAQGSGTAALTLSLQLPLADVDAGMVRGSVRLDGNSLQIAPGVPPLQDLRGEVAFTERGVQVRSTARALGGELRVDGGSQADGSLRFVAQGSLSAEGLRRSLPTLDGAGPGGPGADSAAARLAARLKGQTTARLQLTFVRGQPEWLLTSNLVGLGIDLPAPFGKAAEQPLALRAQLAPLSSPSTAAPEGGGARDALRIELGPLLQAHYQLRGPGAAARVVRGGIGVLQPARLPAAGVEAQASLPRLDLPAWRAALAPGRPAPSGSSGSPERRLAQAGGPPPIASTPPASAAAAGSPGAFIGPAPADPAGLKPGTLPRLPATAGGGAVPRLAPNGASSPTLSPTASPPTARAAKSEPPSDLSSALAGFLPERLQLRTPQLDLGPRSLRDVSLVLARVPTASLWRAQIEADQVAGTVDVADDGSRISARLSRLVVPASDGGAAADGPARADEDDLLPDDPASVPALDIVAEQFDWRGLKLGRLEVQAENQRDSSGQRLWRLNRLELANAHARLSGTGAWQPAPRGAARRQTQMDFTLELADSGALLGRLGWPQTVRGGKGRLVGKIAWPGSPLAAGTAGLDGALRIELASGQFLKAEPGAARLLGVLSLQSLPRRLLLDFRDVFQQGFAFDRIDGDVVLDNGVARTRNLRMKGLQAVVLMEGSADLNRETQDLNVWVVPEINAGAASLAYAAVNPAIGLGTFIAQYLLRKPLAEANTREFRVTGSWADPQVERVARGQLQPGAALADGAPPGPAAPTGSPQADRSPADRRPAEPGPGDRHPADRSQADRIQAERNPAPRAPAAAQAAAAASVPR